MIKICGFAISNFYNKIKFILLEKGIPFVEEQVMPSQSPDLLKRSPLGKIPFIETEIGNLSESQVILEYLEDAYPEKPLYPTNSFEKAKCRELLQHLELNTELHAHSLIKGAFFGGAISEEAKNNVKERLEIGLNGFNSLAKFSPFVMGDVYSFVDGIVWLHLGMISMITQKVYGEDLVATHIPNVEEYMRLIESRPSIQKIAADREKAIAAFFK
jgi:glutathione S-transferase